MLDEYWDEICTPHSGDFYFWSDWLFQYYYELPLGEAIESSYLMCKSEQHRLTPKHDILRSLVPLLEHCFVTIEEDYNQVKKINVVMVL